MKDMTGDNPLDECDEWYGVDLTRTDNSGDVAVYDYFGLSADSIYADHTSHPSIALGVEFIYEAPELADEDLELTALYKNGEYVGLYGDMDAAFASATDYAAEYTVDVGYYSSYASAKTHSLESMITPAVKKLTIRGNNEYVGEGYLDNNSVIYIPHSLTLGSNLELENVELKHKDSSVYCVIKLSIYSLTLSGESVYIGCRVEGNAHTSALVVATARDTYINGGVDIYRLTVNSGRIIFGSDSLIDYSNTKSLYVTGGAKVTVSHYEYK